MWNIIKTTTTLELIWPSCTTTGSVCRILERLAERAIQYWEPYWDDENEEIGIRFASEEDVIEALPGTVVRFEGGHAVSTRKATAGEYDPTTTIGEKKRAVAYVYDGGSLKDLRALSEGGRSVEVTKGNVKIDGVRFETSEYWLVEVPGDEKTQRFNKYVNTLVELAQAFDGELIEGRKEN